MRQPAAALSRSVQCLLAVPLALLAPLALAQITSADTFDIERFSTAGEGWFETFYVEEVQPLAAVLAAGTLDAETQVLVTETAAGPLALVTDQMAYHHIAQGTVSGKHWMATF
jgi:hypothetical protein